VRQGQPKPVVSIPLVQSDDMRQKLKAFLTTA
jgi:hypothetical protein